MPEIFFGNNKLVVENKKLGFSFEWDAIAALKEVELDSNIKVAHAAAWAKGSVMALLNPSDTVIYNAIGLPQTGKHFIKRSCRAKAL